MDQFSFGARDNGIIQIAYTVADIQKAMRHYTELLHVGPWFLVGPFVPPKGLYRGVTTKMRVSLALAFAGETNIELIQQHDEEPSVFRETLKARGAHGFHHWGRSGRAISRKASRTTVRWATPKRFPIPRPWDFASSISIRSAICRACLKSSR